MVNACTKNIRRGAGRRLLDSYKLDVFFSLSSTILLIEHFFDISPGSILLENKNLFEPKTTI
jgi:hypothetical protein